MFDQECFVFLHWSKECNIGDNSTLKPIVY